MHFHHSPSPVDYEDAMAQMDAHVEATLKGGGKPIVWLLEHPPLYTAGSSAKGADLLEARFPVYESGRGGQYTYHGPGQRIAYVIADLKQLFAPAQPDLRHYIERLEQWIIATLGEFGVEGFVRAGRVGVWVNQVPGSRFQISESAQNLKPETCDLKPEAKIAAIGVRVRKWVAYHGICINVHPDLSHYSGIVPCGIKEYGVTSLQALGINATLSDVDAALKKNAHLLCSI